MNTKRISPLKKQVYRDAVNLQRIERAMALDFAPRRERFNARNRAREGKTAL